MPPIRLITPALANMASLSMVFPEEAWPTIAKLRISEGWYSFIKVNCTRSFAIWSRRSHRGRSVKTVGSGASEYVLTLDFAGFSSELWTIHRPAGPQIGFNSVCLQPILPCPYLYHNR